MSQPITSRHVRPLRKQNSWSPDILRDEAWTVRKRNSRLRRGSSVTDDDLDELRACFELGFNLDSPEVDPKLTNTFPALEFYHAVVNRGRLSGGAGGGLSRSSSVSLSDSDSLSRSCSFNGDCYGDTKCFIDPGESPEMVKTRLRQWAQVVACSLRQTTP